MLDDVGITAAAEEGLIVLGKCNGEQRKNQLREKLAWSALTGCGFKFTWTECLLEENLQYQKRLTKKIVKFFSSCARGVLSTRQDL